MVTFPVTSYLIFQYPFRLNSPGIFTIIIHEGLHGGNYIDEEIKGSVKFLKGREKVDTLRLRRGNIFELPSYIKLPYKASPSPSSFFNYFSLEIVALTSPGIGFAPSVKDVTREVKEGEIVRIKDLGIKLFIPKYASSGTYLALIVYIASFPNLKIYYIFLGSLREYIFSPLYFFQDWYYIEVE
ncbi:hypothetical protein HRbin06_00860 [archaeon HR06]|nr:hypothetical protein HRbin06_00860 [archaeon HR06]